MTTGLAIWCMPTAALINVRDGDYDQGGALLAFAGSVQLLWMIVVLFVLPIEKRAGRSRPASTGATGSLPAPRWATGSSSAVVAGGLAQFDSTVALPTQDQRAIRRELDQTRVGRVSSGTD